MGEKGDEWTVGSADDGADDDTEDSFESGFAAGYTSGSGSGYGSAELHQLDGVKCSRIQPVAFIFESPVTSPGDGYSLSVLDLAKNNMRGEKILSR